MNTADKELFEYFYDLNGILDYKDSGNLCETLYQSCHKSLEENLFSDINIQDSEGNTLLHVLLHYTKGTALAMKYTNILFSKGANPLILNHNDQNCFQYGSRNNINEFWRQFDSLGINSIFTTTTQGFNREFKQFLFNDKCKYNSFYIKPENLMKFLKDNDLYNNSNMAKLLSTNIHISIRESIPFFQSLTSRFEDNTIFLKEMLCNKGVEVSLTRKENLQIFQDFVYNSNFSIDHEFLDMLVHHKISKITGQTNNWKDQLFNYFTEIVVDSNIDLNQSLKISDREITYSEFFKTSPLQPYFLSLKLNRELPNKDIVINKKKI